MWGQLREHPESIPQALTAQQAPAWAQTASTTNTTSGLSPWGFTALDAQVWGLDGFDLERSITPVWRQVLCKNIVDVMGGSKSHKHQPGQRLRVGRDQPQLFGQQVPRHQEVRSTRGPFLSHQHQKHPSCAWRQQGIDYSSSSSSLSPFLPQELEFAAGATALTPHPAELTCPSPRGGSSTNVFLQELAGFPALPLGCAPIYPLLRWIQQLLPVQVIQHAGKSS